jgi:hypothetical protein
VADQDNGDGGRGGWELVFESIEDGSAGAEFVVLRNGRTAAVAGEVGGEYGGVFCEERYYVTPPGFRSMF